MALRAMQLGMHRVRVKDARRFLYSPRSGRVRRYSPIALAIGAPFDGIDRGPSERERALYRALHWDGVRRAVKLWTPGLGQMLHGSALLKTVRGAFIPFDCSAISVASPQDAIVPLDGTRLPAGSFEDMHNVEVSSVNAFDVAEVVSPVLRPALELGLRKLLNEHA